MTDERSKEERREANRVDIGGPTYRAPSYPKFRIYENTVDPKEFEPWLRQFLIELVEPKPPGAPIISVWWAALSYPIPALELANHELPLNKPFRLDMLIYGAALFSVHFAPKGKRVYVLFVGYDILLLQWGFYPIMRERLEFAFPTTQAAAAQEQGRQEKDNLTRREREVAQGLAEGLDDNGIAEQLVIAAATAKKHRQRIAEKWSVGEGIEVLRTEAMRRGYDKGI